MNEGADLRVVHEAEEFGSTLPGAQSEYRRAGPGTGVTTARLWRQADLVTGRIRFGFPMLGSLDVGDDRVLFGIPLTTPPGSMWEGVDLDPGMVAMVSAGGHHQAADVIGLEIGLIALGLDDLRAAAEDLGRAPAIPQNAILDSRSARGITGVFRQDPSAGNQWALVSELALAMSEEPRTRARGSSHRLSSIQITERALEHARAAEVWMPSSLELCRALGVSERRLQTAFKEIYDTPPLRFFRLRALSEAKSRLASSQDSGSPITRIALDLGFTHMSHFAKDYRRHLGESPSETIANARRSG